MAKKATFWHNLHKAEFSIECEDNTHKWMEVRRWREGRNSLEHSKFLQNGPTTAEQYVFFNEVSTIVRVLSPEKTT